MDEQNQWWTQFEQAHTNCGDGPANNIQIHCSHVLALLRERNRYREALEQIRDSPSGKYALIFIAREALEPQQ